MKKRRILSIICSILLGTSMMVISKKDVQAYTAGFVYASGQNFMLDGKPYYFQGNNLYYVGLMDGFASNTDIDNLMYNSSQKGIKVIRMWGFNDGGSNGIQTSLGVYNETALQRLDYAIKKAKDNGMKVIIPFVNNWSDYGGMGWYVNQRLGAGHTKNEFFTNTSCKQDYKNYVNMLLNRKNVYTGLQYKSEPAVFAWELANEPSGYDTGLPSNGDNWDATGTKINSWLNEMSTYVKGIDTSHMVTTGEEGYKVGGTDWLDNGCKSLDFKGNISLPKIDFATIHVYPDNWGKTPDQISTYMQDRASIAHAANKPIILEEYGRKASAGDRDTSYTKWHNTANANNFAGTMVWQMVNTIRDMDFDFTFSSSTASIIQNQASYMNGKNTGTASAVVKYNFENSVEGWTARSVTGGPWSVTEWAANGTYSLKADINLVGGSGYYLEKNAADSYSGKTLLKARVRTAAWGNMGTGMTAKLFVKTGSTYQWFDGGAVAIDSNTTTLTVDLTKVANIGSIQSIGVQFVAGTGASGTTSIYVDYVTLE